MDGTSGLGASGVFAVSTSAQEGGSALEQWTSMLIGEEALLAECGDLLRRNGHRIAAVVARQGPAVEWAYREGIPLLGRPSDLLNAGLGPVDFLFSITNLAVLSDDILALASRAAINFHDGPLPAYAGLNTPVWALLAGEREHGVTWHLMTQSVDGGDVIAARSVPIDDGESAFSLNTKCFEAGLHSFEAIVSDLPGAVAAARPQGSSPQKWFGLADRPPAAGAIDWTASATEIARQVQALDFGPRQNPLGLAKAMLDGEWLHIQQVRVLETRSGLPAGTVLDGGAVATGTHDLEIVKAAYLDGRGIDFRRAAGKVLQGVSEAAREKLTALDGAAATYESWWRRRLAGREPTHLPQFRMPQEGDAPAWTTQDQELALQHGRVDVLSATIAYLGRLADKGVVELGYTDPVYKARLEGQDASFSPELPLRLAIDWDAPADSLETSVQTAVAGLHKRVGIARDLIARTPELRGKASFAHPVKVELVDRLDDARPDAETILHIAIATDRTAWRWTFNPSALDADVAQDLQRGLMVFLGAAQSDPTTPIGQLPVLDEQEYRQAVYALNETRTAAPLATHWYRLFAEQAARTPDSVAVTSRGVSLSYAELDRRSNRLARFLAAQGVGPDVLVGLNVERSVELLVCLLGIHKAGGASVPLDPAYPPERLAHMVADSGMKLMISQSGLAPRLGVGNVAVLCIDQLHADLGAVSDEAFDAGVSGEDLAYVIYTSGSTGKPKGVMVEHRNLANFFVGMDQHLEPDGVWLAVTSLSFDISVLELTWPLTHGYHVVIATEREVRGDVPAGVEADGAIDFSLFYFASSDAGSAAEQYRLLLEGARFADAHGFAAVWTPERHFHAFGGPYPNPAVAAAALATVTSRIAIRAGSVVGTLHHPIRIAEEWALVDNLSNGRVGIAFASGWQPNDFVLAPANFADRTGALKQTVEDVRALWRGETRTYPGPLGDVAVTTYPRPVQPELPCWITSAGNPETFAEAGRIGANILTHLLGQTVDEVAAKIAAYRQAWREAGHPGEGHVTLMLHTFVSEDGKKVRDIVRQPLIDYLRTSTNLLKQYAWSFPAFKRPSGSGDGKDQPDLANLSPEETDALLEHSFDRYFETSGLFGTPEECIDMVRLLRRKGVDEIGSLIDFGVPVPVVLENLPALNRLRQLSASPNDRVERTLAELMQQYGVSHLQGTPSLIAVLAEDTAARPQLAKLRRLMVGGEAFPPQLADDLSGLVGGTVMNMYGPTETTIWSAVHALDPGKGAPPLGRPLANQQIYILDSRSHPVRFGTPGELVIGGDGVVRGYLGRPELTAERFIAHPFVPGARAYRTGDLACQRADGTLEFLGRLDHQVKIRGYRIELGEIEAMIAQFPGIREVVVVADLNQGSPRLLAYASAERAGTSPDGLRDHLRQHLPEFMIPSSFTMVDRLPRTPNGKIDRAGLPQPAKAGSQSEPQTPAEAPNDLEAQIQSVWRDVLKLDRIGLSDNFFDIGGHSLLAVQVHRRLSSVVAKPLSLTDIFRFPTVSSLGAHLSLTAPTTGAARQGHDRAVARRAAMQRRAVAAATVRI